MRTQMMGNFFLSYFSPFEHKAKCVTIDYLPGEDRGVMKIIGTKTDIESGRWFVRVPLSPSV